VLAEQTPKAKERRKEGLEKGEGRPITRPDTRVSGTVILIKLLPKSDLETITESGKRDHEASVPCAPGNQPSGQLPLVPWGIILGQDGPHQ